METREHVFLSSCLKKKKYFLSIVKFQLSIFIFFL